MAGEIVEMKYADAKALLDDGRARRLEDPEVKIPSAQASTAEVQIPLKKKKR
jgi:hypothetical protein